MMSLEDVGYSNQLRTSWGWGEFHQQEFTLQGTNISPKNGILKMIFLFPRWDMLIPWRVESLFTICIFDGNQSEPQWLKNTQKSYFPVFGGDPSFQNTVNNFMCRLSSKGLLTAIYFLRLHRWGQDLRIKLVCTHRFHQWKNPDSTKTQRRN